MAAGMRKAMVSSRVSRPSGSHDESGQRSVERLIAKRREQSDRRAGCHP